MMCVTTRFRLKHFWYLVPMYLTYRHMRGDLNRAPGLIRYAFLVQSPTACCTFSVWQSESAIIRFSNVPSHINAVRYAKRRCREIWSAYWQVDGVSKHARQWQGRPPWPPFVQHPTRRGRLVERTIVEEAW
jgi:heme-degrading monooxygenase HmoA